MTEQTVDEKRRFAQGSAEWRRGCWHARISLPGQPRKRIKLEVSGRLLDRFDEDRDEARELARDLSEQLRAQQSVPGVTMVKTGITVREFGEKWTSGDLFKLYGEVRGLKLKASANDDRNRLRKYVYPYIGERFVAEVTEELVEAAFAKAFRDSEKRRGKALSPLTRRHVYQASRRLFDLSIKPGRLRTTNPVSVDLQPNKGSPKLYSFLYPRELLTLLGCTEVPLARRVYYALATYTGLRKSSLKVFAWRNLDFEHSTITSLVSKTELPQIFAQADPLLPGLETLMIVLKRYHELCGCPRPSELIISSLQCKKNGEATALREDLQLAGIDRDILFAKSDQIEPLRFHDLRATFVTWSKRAGKGTGWIGDRTGHVTEAMMKRYDRGARMLADLKLEPFPDISSAIPELSEDLGNVTRLKRPT